LRLELRCLLHVWLAAGWTPGGACCPPVREVVALAVGAEELLDKLLETLYDQLLLVEHIVLSALIGHVYASLYSSREPHEHTADMRQAYELC
jgi:hypothetical protein